MTGLTEAHPVPVRRRRRTAAAALTAAAILGALAPAPALAAPLEATPPDSAGCEDARPYGASAGADLLHLHTLAVPELGIGPLADIRVASTGAGMAAEAEVAAAAAARDVTANLRGLDTVGLLPAGGLGHRVHQQAPPSNPAPADGSGAPADLGVLRAGATTTSAYATWHESMRCGTNTGPTSVATASSASASLINAELLPTVDGRALVSLSAGIGRQRGAAEQAERSSGRKAEGHLASRTETGLVTRSGAPAARAVAEASLTDLRVFAGSDSEVSVRLVSEPQLVVTATGRPDTSSVTYHAPALEISGPGIGAGRLDAPGAHLDIVIPDAGSGDASDQAELPVLAGDAPLAGLLAGVDTELLGQLEVGTDPTERPLPLSGLLGLSKSEPTAAPDPPAGRATILRLSIGEVEEATSEQTVRAATASVRVQIISDGATVLDLGLALLEVAATAPAAAPPASDHPEADACAECPAAGLPVTSSTFGLLAGAGILLLVAGRFLLLTAGLRAGLSRARG